MSATDPLREALSAALSLHMAQPPNAPWRTDGAQERWRDNLLDALEAAAREAPAAVPAEPEAWEWRVVSRHGIATRPTAIEANATRSVGLFGPGERLERRRPGTAPGPWERVEPEPRTDKPPREFWREVPCGHPPDPVAWHNGAGHVCHCGNGLDDAKGIAVAAAPGPVVLCQKCGCNVACPEPRP